MVDMDKDEKTWKKMYKLKTFPLNYLTHDTDKSSSINRPHFLEAITRDECSQILNTGQFNYCAPITTAGSAKLSCDVTAAAAGQCVRAGVCESGSARARWSFTFAH